jgi:hypothetical protein
LNPESSTAIFGQLIRGKTGAEKYITIDDLFLLFNRLIKKFSKWNFPGLKQLEFRQFNCRSEPLILTELI